LADDCLVGSRVLPVEDPPRTTTSRLAAAAGSRMARGNSLCGRHHRRLRRPRLRPGRPRPAPAVTVRL